MKNNEIMISVQFDFPKDSDTYGAKFFGITDSLAFLVKDDITLKAFIEGLYYGLHNNFPEHFLLFKDYIKHRKQFVVDYSRKGQFKVINFEKELLSKKKTLIELGFVTSSVLLITMKQRLESKLLFDTIPSSYILDSDDNPLEYNISSRTLEAVDSSDIEILPPGDTPEKDERTLGDILIPTILSTGGMLGVRVAMSKSSSASGMGGMMWMMTAATGVMTLVTSTYNYFKQGATNTKKKNDWKDNYEKYIKRLIDEKIGIWQKADLTYLQSLYPDMAKLFTQLSTLDSAIFSRSQNDNDFMRITLGVSEHVKPLFDIKYEKKDEIFSDVYYYLRYEKCTNSEDMRIAGIYILTPESELPWYSFIKKRKRKVAESKLKESQRKGEISSEKVLLSDLPYKFSTEYFRYIDGKAWGISGIKAPYMLDIRNAGVLGIISPDNSFAHDAIKHIVMELAYYHSPEDIQFVFFFEEGLSIEEQKNGLKYISSFLTAMNY